ncbi:MAG: methyltransferase domain-containing protein [Chloroflexi bacterium]|nr:methyltransferase domain-containing protein [Chloroflexota bacterium]
MPDRTANSLPAAYFDHLYQEYADPWSFATSEYESAKYDATLAALPRARYQSALEIGCSIGVLTGRLAARCLKLLAVDISEIALGRARQRCASMVNVRFEQLAVPDVFPDEAFDLIVLSEVGYYWSRADLDRARDLIVGHLESGGHALLVHWTPPVADYPLTGDEVHRSFLRAADNDSGIRHIFGRVEPTYRLDLFARES